MAELESPASPWQRPARRERRWSGVWRSLRRSGRFWIAAGLLVALGLMAVWPELFTSLDPKRCLLDRSLQRPQLGHPFGFDLLGCDLYARTIFGARTSLVIGASVVATAAAIALVLGSAAGYVGGLTDAVITRAADAWLSVPLLLGGLFFLSFLDERGPVQVTLVLSLLAWPAVLRLVRASVLQVKTEEFVLAARALGAGHLRILTRHVLPNSLRPLIVYSALFTATAISAEAILSYMGVGLQLPTISWGLMLVGIAPRLAGNPHLLVPGVFLTATVFAFLLLSDALRDAFDPTIR